MFGFFAKRFLVLVSWFVLGFCIGIPLAGGLIHIEELRVNTSGLMLLTLTIIPLVIVSLLSYFAARLDLSTEQSKQSKVLGELTKD